MLQNILSWFNKKVSVSHRSTTLAEAAQLLRRYEKEQSESARTASPQDFVEQIRHVLKGGLSEDERRECLESARVPLMKLVADNERRADGSGR
jgi:hypothetical protein